VLSSLGTPVPAKQKPSLASSIARIILCLLIGTLLVVFLPQLAKADALEDAARALARRVAASLHGNAATCEMRNSSSLGGAEFARISAAFQDELRQRGVKISTVETATTVIVSVTQSPSEYLGVAQIQRKEDPQTLMETLGALKGPGTAELAFNSTLHREPLFSQESPILDVVFAGDGQVAFALGPGEIDSYQRRGGSWVHTGVETLPRRTAPQRNERGFLDFAADTESVNFSRESCLISAQGSGWRCERAKEEQAWPRGVSNPPVTGKKMGAWSSAAQFQADGKTRLVVTATDGLARLYEEGDEPVVAFSGWGSELAGVHSSCGSGGGWQVLRTGAEDWTKADTVQAMEIKGRRAVAVSEAMEFPGAIVTLHTPGTRSGDVADANAKALLVDRNLQTGFYDAYLLSISCSN